MCIYIYIFQYTYMCTKRACVYMYIHKQFNYMYTVRIYTSMCVYTHTHTLCVLSISQFKRLQFLLAREACFQHPMLGPKLGIPMVAERGCRLPRGWLWDYGALGSRSGYFSVFIL